MLKIGLLIAAVVLFIVAAALNGHPQNGRITNAGLAAFAGAFLVP